MLPKTPYARPVPPNSPRALTVPPTGYRRCSPRCDQPRLRPRPQPRPRPRPCRRRQPQPCPSRQLAAAAGLTRGRGHRRRGRRVKAVVVVVVVVMARSRPDFPCEGSAARGRYDHTTPHHNTTHACQVGALRRGGVARRGVYGCVQHAITKPLIDVIPAVPVGALGRALTSKSRADRRRRASSEVQGESRAEV